MKAFFVLAILVATVTAQCDNNNGTNGCPVCGEDELTCMDNSAGPITGACPTCIPNQDGTVDNWGNPCWSSCPVSCQEGEQLCGAGVDPWSGCNMPGWCELSMDPVTECPFHCPTMCAETEIHCSGGMDPNGCMMPDHCFPSQDGTVDNWGNPCWNSCPIVCHEDEQLCGAGVDPWSGCNTSGWCEPAIDPATKCPFHCPTMCAETEMHCYGGSDANGCMMPDICVPSQDTGTVDNWGNPCWNSCPVFCHEGEQVCGDGVDPWSGCKMSGWCEPTMDTLGCPKSCPPNCGPEEKHCWGGVGGDGCNLPDYCVPVDHECGM